MLFENQVKLCHARLASDQINFYFRVHPK